jgi:hypothetical protein
MGTVQRSSLRSRSARTFRTGQSDERCGGRDYRRRLPATRVCFRGVGMRMRTWVKAFTLTGPTREVIDVGH